MNKISVLTIACILVSFSTTKAHEFKNNTEDTSAKETIIALRKIQPSRNEKTVQGYRYTLYAIKDRKKWLFLLVDSIGISSVYLDKTSGQLSIIDKSLSEILFLTIRSNRLKKKKRALILREIELNCFYKMPSKIHKVYNSMKSINKKSNQFQYKSKQEYVKIKNTIPK